MILNIYTANTGASRYIKQVLNDLQRDLDSHTIIVGHFNTPLSILDRSMIQKINKDIQNLNSDLDLIDIYRSKPNRHLQKLQTSKPNRHLQKPPPRVHRIYILLSTGLHLL